MPAQASFAQKLVEARHEEGGMRLPHRAKLGGEAEMRLHATLFEPKADPFLESGRLRDALKPQHVTVKPLGVCFATSRHPELYVVQSSDVEVQLCSSSVCLRRRPPKA